MRVRRNPRSRSTAGVGKITSALMPAAIGAGGALALGMLWTKFSASIPATFQTGAMGSVAQIAAAMGLGVLAGKVAGRQVGMQVAAGAITVTMFNLFSSYASGSGLLAAGGAGSYGGYNGAYTAAGGYGGYATGVAGLGAGPRMRRRGRMGRYVGMNGVARYVGMNGMPPFLNGMGRGQAPRNLNGMGAGPMMMRRGRRGMHGLGYTGPARIARY